MAVAVIIDATADYIYYTDGTRMRLSALWFGYDLQVVISTHPRLLFARVLEQKKSRDAKQMAIHLTSGRPFQISVQVSDHVALD